MGIFCLLALLRVFDEWFPGGLEWSFYDVTVRHLVPEAPTTDEVVPIQIDDYSLEALQERWPLSRATWARIVRKLASYEPAVIALDLYFPEPSESQCTLVLEDNRDRIAASTCGDKDALLTAIDGDLAALNEDAELSRAISEAGIVVLGGVLPAERQPDPLVKSGPQVAAPLSISPDTPLRFSRDQLLASFPDIGVSAKSLGLLNIMPEQDGVVRRHPYLAAWQGQPLPSLALAAVIAAHPESAAELTSRVAELDRGAPLLRFPKPKSPASLIDILESPVRAKPQLKDRIVIVGLTAIGEPERVTLPIRESTVYGLDVHAMAAVNLLHNSYLLSEGWPAWLGLLATLTLLSALSLACGHVDTRWLGFHALGVVVIHLGIFYGVLVTVGWVIPITPVLGGAFLLFAAEASYRTLRLQKRKRQLLEQERINEAKSQLVATVSHELRTPLTSIRGSLGLLAAGAMGELPGSTSEMIRIAHSNTERLIRLVNNLLDLQKLEAGKMKFHFQTLELEPVIEETIAATRAYAEEFGVEISLENIVDSPVHVRADHDLLVQAITNLLSNAIKFSPKGDSVCVKVERTRLTPSDGAELEDENVANDGIRVAIVDHGPGISGEFRKQLFTRFAQASTSRDHPKGTGLGLSIVRSIIAEHGGDVGCDSELGKGSTFYIDLPVARASRSSIEIEPER